MDRGRSPDEPAAEPFVHVTQPAAGPPTPDQFFDESAVYKIFDTDQYFTASKLPQAGTWFLMPETGRPGRAYKVLPGGIVTVTWESFGYSGAPAFEMGDFEKVADDGEWCDKCDKKILPEHEPFCDAEDPSVDEMYESLLTEKYT